MRDKEARHLGSIWRKWDLQVQPIKQEWFKDLKANKDKITNATRDFLQEAAKKEISVVAITDHNCGAAIDAALKVVADEKIHVTVLPGVEIDTQGGFQLLVILNPSYRDSVGESTWEGAVRHFLNHVCQLSSPLFDADGCAHPINGDWHEVIEKICAEDIGLPLFAHSQSEKGLFKKLTATHRRKFFQNNIEGKYCFALDHKTDSDIDKTRQQLKSWGFDPRNYALVKTSDAHHASEVGSVFTWIKSEPTYEGLKQIVYDPTSRISPLDQEPPRPTNTIESITLAFPPDTSLRIRQKDAEDKEEPFCFAGKKQTYFLSPFFNCVIGGRGSGKSTILNLLGQHSTHPASSISFWEKLRPSVDVKDKDVFSFSGIDTFEFIGQSEVEKFATDKVAFTSAIYDRANLLSDGTLRAWESRLSDSIRKLSAFIRTIEEIERIRDEISTRSREKRVFESSIKITSSPAYVEVTERITRRSNQRRELEQWRAAVETLREKLIVIQNLQPPVNTPPNGEPIEAGEACEPDVSRSYAEAYKEAQRNIALAVQHLAPERFEPLRSLERQLSDEIAACERELSDLLSNAGLSDENVLQAKSAPQNLVRLEGELEQLNRLLKDKETELGRYESQLADVREYSEGYAQAIEGAIAPLAAVLEAQAKENENKDIKSISLQYSFDEDYAWQEIAREVYEYFHRRYGKGERPDFLKTYIIDHKEDFRQFSKIPPCLGKETKETGYIKFLRDVFSSVSGRLIFQIIRDRHLYDVSKYKRVHVLYGGKDIERASFGQRCTAVIVVLLLFGNSPLIIDEPEAHLDSSLIANYLVPLIKKKKADRQLIFATHDANFVVNGDAEKIFVLLNNTGRTEIREATIEDLEHRIELLKLDGGKEAFLKRGEKLRVERT